MDMDSLASDLHCCSPVSVPVKCEHVLRDADQVAHVEGEDTGDAGDGEDVDTISG